MCRNVLKRAGEVWWTLENAGLQEVGELWLIAEGPIYLQNVKDKWSQTLAVRDVALARVVEGKGRFQTEMAGSFRVYIAIPGGERKINKTHHCRMSWISEED